VKVEEADWRWWEEAGWRRRAVVFEAGVSWKEFSPRWLCVSGRER